MVTPLLRQKMFIDKTKFSWEDIKMNKLYNVIGLDDLEGTTFARCTTFAKAVIAREKLEKNGFEDMLDIVQDEIPIDTIELNGKLIKL